MGIATAQTQGPGCCWFLALARRASERVTENARLKLMAQAIHDADLADERLGRDEALGIGRVLDG